MKKFGIYLHIPFCRRKCGYCDFYSIVDEAPLRQRFVDAAVKEIRLHSDNEIFRNEQVTSVYFGGGTPSLLERPQIANLLEAIRASFSISADCEISLEANPESLSLEKLVFLKSIGFNRISIGAQSFNDDELKKLGRIHSAEQVINSVEWAKKAGFDNISLDLIFAIPGQTTAQWRSNLLQALKLQPQHLSTYCLTYEPETDFGKKLRSGALKKTSEETERIMYLDTIELLEKHNFSHYEISNFARRNFACRHNQTYWDLSPYLGIGPSAHSYWENHRQWNVRSVANYIEKLDSGNLPIEDEENLSQQQKELEFIFLRLRTGEGISLENYRHSLGKDFLLSHESSIRKLSGHPDAPLFQIEDNRFTLTSAGFVFFDEICAMFAGD